MGARLGRYEVLKHLASGGMADVLLGRTGGLEGFERHVVLKRIKPEHAMDLRFIRMFLDEARVAANLHHQHIVQVHDIGEAAGEYFIAMEYLHGEDVRKILMTASRSHQHVPLGYAMAIVSAAAAGLHYAHERRGPDKRPLGIVHRDISPSNILVGYDGSIKVVDFGIAKASARQESTTGSLKGKVSYMSPEQCKSAEVDRRSDVYSLGVVLYELATTTRLFKGENDYLVMDQIVNGRVPPPRARRPDLPNELSAIIMRAISPDPERRFATADELRLAIDHVADKLGLTASSSAIAAYMRQQFGDKPEPWLDLGGQVIASLAGVGSGPGPRPGGGWTPLWRADDPAPRGSGPMLRPSGPLGTGVGDVVPHAAGEPSVRRSVDRRAGTAPTDARMGWESQPSRAPWAVTPARALMVGVPLIAAMGIGLWWFSGMAAPWEDDVPPLAATQPAQARAAMVRPDSDPAPPRAAASAPASDARPSPAASGVHGADAAGGDSAKRSASRRTGAAKAVEGSSSPAADIREIPRSAGGAIVAPPPAPTVASPSPAPTAASPSPAPTVPSVAPGRPPAASAPAAAAAAPPADPAVAPTAAAPPPLPQAAASAHSTLLASLDPVAPTPAGPPPVVEPAQLSHGLIDRIASDHTRELSKCDGGDELRGEITVRFTVDAAGRVTKTQLATTAIRPKVAACILRSVQKWQFPTQPATGAQGTYTLSFQ